MADGTAVDAISSSIETLPAEKRREIILGYASAKVQLEQSIAIRDVDKICAAHAQLKELEGEVSAAMRSIAGEYGQTLNNCLQTYLTLFEAGQIDRESFARMMMEKIEPFLETVSKVR